MVNQITQKKNYLQAGTFRVEARCDSSHNISHSEQASNSEIIQNLFNLLLIPYDANETASSTRVLVVTELLNIAVNDLGNIGAGVHPKSL